MNTTKPLVEIQCPFLNLTNSTMFCNQHVTFRADYNQMVLGDGSQAHFKRLLLEALIREEVANGNEEKISERIIKAITRREIEKERLKRMDAGDGVI